MLETMPHCLYNSQLCTCLSGCLWVYQEKVRGVVYGGLVERMHPVLTDLCSTVWLLSCDVDVQLCREEADRNQTACQHFQNHLLVRNEQMDRAPAGREQSVLDHFVFAARWTAGALSERQLEQSAPTEQQHGRPAPSANSNRRGHHLTGSSAFFPWKHQNISCSLVDAG